MAIPRSVLAPTSNRRPMVLPLVAAPFNSMTGLPAKPGWVVASITTGSVMAGSAFVGVIVNGGGAADLKNNRVQTRIGVGRQDGLAKRSRATVGGIRHHNHITPSRQSKAARQQDWQQSARPNTTR